MTTAAATTDALERWAEALARLRPPFLAAGRTRDGLDCAGLCALGYREVLGVAFPDDYGTRYGAADLDDYPRRAALLADAFRHWTRVADGHERPGDLVWVALRGRPENVHPCLVLAAGRVIHTTRRDGVVIEAYRDGAWPYRALHFYRYVTEVTP